MAGSWFGRRSTPDHRSVIHRIIEERTTPLQARLRARMIPTLVERVVRREPDQEIFLAESEVMQVLSVALHLRHTVVDLEAEHAEIEARFADADRAYRRQSGAKARRKFLEAYLTEHAASPRQLRGDLKALDREMAWDAVRERHDGNRHEVLAPAELALDFMAGAFAWLDAEAGDERAEVQEVVRAAGLPAFLMDRAGGDPRWATRFAAIRALRAVHGLEGRALPGALLDRLERQARDVEEHPWVQDVAMDLIWRADLERGEALCRDRLLVAEPPSERDFLARRLFVDALVRRPPIVACGILLDLVAHRDPSEHLRMGICEVAGALIPHHAPAFELLDRLAQVEGEAAEASARVRCIALRVARNVASLGPEVEARTVALFARALEQENEDLTVAVASEEIVALASVVEDMDQGRRRAFVDALVPPLVRLATRDDRSAAIQEQAAATLEAVDREVDPRRREVTRALAAQVTAIPIGGAARIPRPEPVSKGSDGEHRLGRVLADLTRRDWGVDVRVGDDALQVRRGDHFATRLWRVLHELRIPAPNKRQGFRHTVGRTYRGEVRAHPGRLDEVTATVVPGERLRSATEGGWGRHLPLIDDVLSLPLWGEKVIRIFSSHGTTKLRWRVGLRARIVSRLKIVLGYAKLAATRFQSLQATEDHERGQYVKALREVYGVEADFVPHPPPGGGERTVPGRIQALFPAAIPPSAQPQTEPDPDSPSTPAPTASAALVPFVPQIQDWARLHTHYFLSMEGTSQTALALFLGAISVVFMGDSYRRYRRIRVARAAIPLSVGGWGTRGKSGTERLKAGLFHGLGYQVFSKTTGCEAMFIHSVPEGPPVEVYAFRPYGKATIWEQRDLLELGRNLGSQVFLWECMALNWRYVRILQHAWMRDDFCTITNAYPDHEDVQGPAGMNVAQTISNFVPTRGVLINSETNFEAIMQQASDQNGTRMISLDDAAGDLIAEDLLDLFPYKEHPRNIALVARLAEELEIDRYLAIVNMADNVVPDLGVLKTYPASRVHGRVLQFINGCSANERTGYLTSWNRTGCGTVSVEDEPEQLVMTVVNNRDDRIARSEVFARILTEDVNVDRHVLIGTNIRGLLGYIQNALAAYLPAQKLVAERDFEEDPELPFQRLARAMQRLRIPLPSWEAIERRVELYAHGAALELGDLSPVKDACQALIDGDAAVSAFETLSKQVAEQVGEVLGAALEPMDEPPDYPEPEILDGCPKDEMIRHTLRQITRIVVHARLRARLKSVVEARDASGIEPFHEAFRETWSQMFLESLEIIYDPTVKGDHIVKRVAQAVPPGTRVRIMGTQNIKGTGLDFVYRWLALETVHQQVRLLAKNDAQERIAALRRIQGFGDHGIMDLGMLEVRLGAHEGKTPEELDARESALQKVTALRKKKVAALGAAAGPAKAGGLAKFLGWLEGWVDFADAVFRFYGARRIMDDLSNQRISHQRAAVLMREIYAREKGGWMMKMIGSKSTEDND